MTTDVTASSSERLKELLVAPPPNTLTIGVVGVSGAVGKEMVSCLVKRGWVAKTIKCYASERSAGGKVQIEGQEFTIEVFNAEEAKKLDVVFLAVSGEFAKEHARELAKTTLVIDNSSALRYDDDVPLVVPEVNGIRDLNSGSVNLVANPNCTTAVAVVALWPLHRRFGLKKVIVSTYQAASGAGVQGMEELRTQTAAVLRATSNEAAGSSSSSSSAALEVKVFPYPLAFNLIPQIDVFLPNGYTKEEMKVVWECRKIMGLPELPVSCTAVRIPIMRAHSEAITIETSSPVEPAEALAVLKDSVGVRVVDDLEKKKYPMPMNATGEDDVEVGRVRRNLIFGDHGLDFFVSGDQLLRGAALNAVLIAEMVFSMRRESAAAAAAPNRKKIRSS